MPLMPALPPPGTYSYTSTMNGQPIGTTAITLRRAASGQIVLTETGSGSMNGENGSVQDTLTLDATLAPQSYDSLASIADSRNMKATIAFAPAQARQSGDVVRTYDLASPAKHFVLLDVGPFTGFFMLPAQMQAWSDAPVVALVPNFAHAFTIAPEAASKPSRPADVPKNDRVLGFGAPVQFSVWYDPKTLVVDRVDVPENGLIVTRLTNRGGAPER